LNFKLDKARHFCW